MRQSGIRSTEVKEYRVNRRDAEPLHDTREIAEVVVHQMRDGAFGPAVARICRTPARDRRTVGINADDSASLAKRREKSGEVPSPPSVASTTVSLGCMASAFNTSSISTLS